MQRYEFTWMWTGVRQHDYWSVPKSGCTLQFEPWAHLAVCEAVPTPRAFLSQDLIIKCSIFSLWRCVKKIISFSSFGKAALLKFQKGRKAALLFKSAKIYAEDSYFMEHMFWLREVWIMCISLSIANTTGEPFPCKPTRHAHARKVLWVLLFLAPSMVGRFPFQPRSHYLQLIREGAAFRSAEVMGANSPGSCRTPALAPFNTQLTQALIAIIQHSCSMGKQLFSLFFKSNVFKLFFPCKENSI